MGAVQHRRDLLLVAYVALVAAGRVASIVFDVGFSPMALAVSVMTMPTLWAVKHNAIHRPVLVAASANRILAVVLSVLTGTSSTWTAIVHCEIHHRHNNGPGDWTGVERAPSFRWRALRVAIYPFVIAGRLWTERRQHLADKPAVARRVMAETAIVALVVMGALVVSLRATLWYVVVPIAFGQWFLIAMNYLQHAEGIVGTELEHTVNDTGRVFNFFLLNLGYHAAHHRHPGHHWSELPALHRRHVVGRVAPRYNRPNFARRLIGEVLFSVEPRPRRPEGRDATHRPWWGWNAGRDIM